MSVPAMLKVSKSKRRVHTSDIIKKLELPIDCEVCINSTLKNQTLTKTFTAFVNGVRVSASLVQGGRKALVLQVGAVVVDRVAVICPINNEDAANTESAILYPINIT